MRYLLITALIMLLTACSSATSQAPTVTAEELAREQEEQKKILAAEGNNKAITAKTATPAMEARLKRVSSPIYAAGRMVCQELGATNCELPFLLESGETAAVNAYTDGKKVVVTPAMMEFANSDDQLATVLAHEYAHAVMAHPSKTGQNATMGGLLGMAVDVLANSQGMNTSGMFSKLGAQSAVMKYSQGFEKEADYIGMYILKRSGYDIDKAAHLWRRMATLNPDGIYVGSTHPTSAERYVLLEKSAAEIKAKQSAGQKLLPEFKPAS